MLFKKKKNDLTSSELNGLIWDCGTFLFTFRCRRDGAARSRVGLTQIPQLRPTYSFALRSELQQYWSE